MQLHIMNLKSPRVESVQLRMKQHCGGEFQKQQVLQYWGCPKEKMVKTRSKQLSRCVLTLICGLQQQTIVDMIKSDDIGIGFKQCQCQYAYFNYKMILSSVCILLDSHFITFQLSPRNYLQIIAFNINEQGIYLGTLQFDQLGTELQHQFTSLMEFLSYPKSAESAVSFNHEFKDIQINLTRKILIPLNHYLLVNTVKVNTVKEQGNFDLFDEFNFEENEYNKCQDLQDSRLNKFQEIHSNNQKEENLLNYIQNNLSQAQQQADPPQIALKQEQNFIKPVTKYGKRVLLSPGYYDSRINYGQKSAYPFDYKALKTYRSMTSPNKLSNYFCSTFRDDNTIKFKIISEDDPQHPIIGSSCAECWKQVAYRIMKVNGESVPISLERHSARMFGFQDKAIKQILSNLPNSPLKKRQVEDQDNFFLILRKTKKTSMKRQQMRSKISNQEQSTASCKLQYENDHL